MVYVMCIVPNKKEDSIHIQKLNVHVVDSVDTDMCFLDTIYYQAMVKSATLYSVVSTELSHSHMISDK